VQTIEKLADYVKSPIMVFRELTKVHEEVLEGLPLELARTIKAPMGEYTLVIPAADASEVGREDVSDDRLREEFGEITKTGAPRSPREAARQVAERFGVSTRRVYQATRNDNPA
jgi:16S rRNA C1402 (ribose-2'-O) methylase RsmI